MQEGIAFAERMAALVKARIAQEVEPLRATIATLEKQIAVLEARAPVAGPKGDKGEKGDAIEGPVGPAGKDADMDAIFKRIDERIDAIAKNIPTPKNGKDGRDGANGRDGVGIVELLQNKDGDLIAIMSDGVSKNVGRVQGRDGKDGKPGENANLDAIKEMICGLTQQKGFEPEAIKALIPEPVKGDPGDKGETGESAYQIAVRHGFKGSEREWIASLKGDSGADGNDGADAAPVDYERLTKEIEVRVAEVAKAIPVPKDGRDGRDGVDADPVDYERISKEIQSRIAEVAKSIPTPRDGVDADPVDYERISKEIQSRIAEVAKSIPTPRDGVDADPVDYERISKEIQSRIAEVAKSIPTPRDGVDGKDGRDGVSIKDAATDDEGRILITLTDGTILKTGSVRGADGFGFEDMRLEQADERTLRLVFERGDRIKTFELYWPIQIFRGVYEDGKTYEPGDVVTDRGCQWTAQAKTTERPGNNSNDWQLSVKKGRDGKDGQKGEKGDRGDKGRDGRDLTQIDPNTGQKW